MVIVSLQLHSRRMILVLTISKKIRKKICCYNNMFFFTTQSRTILLNIFHIKYVFTRRPKDNLICPACEMNIVCVQQIFVFFDVGCEFMFKSFAMSKYIYHTLFHKTGTNKLQFFFFIYNRIGWIASYIMIQSLSLSLSLSLSSSLYLTLEILRVKIENSF